MRFRPKRASTRKCGIVLWILKRNGLSRTFGCIQTSSRAERLWKGYEFYQRVGRITGTQDWRAEVLRCILEDGGSKCFHRLKGRPLATKHFPVMLAGELVHNALWAEQARQRLCSWIDELRKTMSIKEAASLIVSSELHPNVWNRGGLISFICFEQRNASRLFENPWFVPSRLDRNDAITAICNLYDREAAGEPPTQAWVITKNSSRNTTSKDPAEAQHVRARLIYPEPDWAEEYYHIPRRGKKG